MATHGRLGELFGENLMQNSNEDTNFNCVNCASIQKQLHHVLMELKTAETSISLLRDDIKHNSSEAPVDPRHLNTPGVNSECEEGKCDKISGNGRQWCVETIK